ncbi:MAG: hypothetical protein EPN64_04585 [Burkholderiaceae bacterium]|nr:MAG: hypothetical protein EPN64_04585 [Burkholderiaceae bacterium]
MKIAILARAAIGSLIAAAALSSAPAMAQYMLSMPYPAGATSGNSRAVVGIDIASVQNQVNNIQSTVTGITTGAIPVPSTAKGGFATQPGQAVWMIVWEGYYYEWTNTVAWYDHNFYLNDSGGPPLMQVPLGACIYGEGNNNPAWYAYDFQCPAGSGWVGAISYETIYNNYAGY